MSEEEIEIQRRLDEIRRREEERRQARLAPIKAAPINAKNRRNPKAHAAAVRLIMGRFGGLKRLVDVEEADRLGLLAKLELKPGVQNLTKAQIGPHVVVGYAGSAGSPTPWWRVRCRACKHVTFERGNALRADKGLSCFSCGWSGHGPKPKAST